MNTTVTINVKLFIPNIGKNVKAEINSNGIDMTYILGCDSSFKSVAFRTIRAKNNRYYAIAKWTIPFQRNMDDAILNSYYKTKHAMMLELVKHKQTMLAHKEEYIRILCSR
jgi:hypothetical protein